MRVERFFLPVDGPALDGRDSPQRGECYPVADAALWQLARVQRAFHLISISLAFCVVASAAEAFRATPLTVAPSNRIGFSLLTSQQTGIQFTNVLEQSRYTTNQIYLNGS